MDAACAMLPWSSAFRRAHRGLILDARQEEKFFLTSAQSLALG